MKKMSNVTKGFNLSKSAEKAEKSQRLQNKIKLQIEEIIKTENMIMKFQESLADQKNMLAKLKRKLKTVLTDDEIKNLYCGDNTVLDGIENRIFISADVETHFYQSNTAMKENLKRKIPDETKDQDQEGIIRKKNRGVLQVSNSITDVPIRTNQRSRSADTEYPQEKGECGNEQNRHIRQSIFHSNALEVHEPDPRLQLRDDTGPEERDCSPVVLDDTSITHDNVIDPDKGRRGILYRPGQDRSEGLTGQSKLARKPGGKSTEACFTIKALTQEELQQAEQRIRSLYVEEDVLCISSVLRKHITVAEGVFVERALKDGRIRADNAHLVPAFQRKLCLLPCKVEQKSNMTTQAERTIRILVQTNKRCRVSIQIEVWRTVERLLSKAKKCMKIDGRARLKVRGRFLDEKKLLCEEGLADNQVVRIIKMTN